MGVVKADNRFCVMYIYVCVYVCVLLLLYIGAIVVVVVAAVLRTCACTGTRERMCIGMRVHSRYTFVHTCTHVYGCMKTP